MEGGRRSARNREGDVIARKQEYGVSVDAQVTKDQSMYLNTYK